MEKHPGEVRVHDLCLFPALPLIWAEAQGRGKNTPVRTYIQHALPAGISRICSPGPGQELELNKWEEMNEAFPTLYSQTPAGTQEEEAFICKQDVYI